MLESGTAADRYAARFGAERAQRERICGEPLPADRWVSLARRAQPDPLRPLDGTLAALASYVEPGDLLLDVGGGAGRNALPLARRCREVINVEPSPSMRAAFEEARAAAGIANARAVATGWIEAGEIAGDVVLAAHSTYFVHDIVPFLRKLHRAARRRVIILALSVPSPSQDTRLFERFYGEPREDEPSFRELLAVLWELGLLPEVRVLGFAPGAAADLPTTSAGAVDFALSRLCPQDAARAQPWVEERLDDLFAREDDRFVPRWRLPSRDVLITWATGGW